MKGQGIDGDAVLIEIVFDGLPIPGFAQMP
jgi:hypothetical protein